MDGTLVIQTPQVSPVQPRSIGRLDLSVRRHDGQDRLADLHQGGCLKAFFPTRHGGPLTGLLCNSSGGVTGGDVLQVAAEARTGARLVLTTQAAERIYRSGDGTAGRIVNRLTIGAGARIDWLPQETILFDGAALDRRLQIDMAADATVLAVEPLLFGRLAMGEARVRGDLADRIELRRGGELVLADRTRMRGDLTSTMDTGFAGGGARAGAAILYAGPRAETALAALRKACGAPGAGVSLIRPGVVLARVLAADGFDLRARVIPALAALHGAELPRSWML